MSKEQYTPDQINKIEKERIISDADLLKGGARLEINEQGEKHILPTESQVKGAKEEMDSNLASVERRREIDKIKETKVGKLIEETLDYDFDYFSQILAEGQTPESYIWNMRRILRSTIQTIIRNLERTGKVHQAKDIDKYYESGKAGKIYALETKDPNFSEFVDALNVVILQYDHLYNGSEKIDMEERKKRYKE